MKYDVAGWRYDEYCLGLPAPLAHKDCCAGILILPAAPLLNNHESFVGFMFSAAPVLGPVWQREE
tara:strand:- start:766 stop:960 length:195 start_codon:yes stop_codon:yes gene_type:complete